MPEETNEAIDFVEMSKTGTTAEVQALTERMREAKREATEKENAAYEFPSDYDPNMGLKQGHITELRLFFTVKPGHAEALKEALRVFNGREQRNSKAAHLMTGIQSMTCTLFDNDTRYLHTTEFDTDWDAYIDDTVPGELQRRMYAEWLQHLVEFGDFSPDNLPTANDIKVLFNSHRVTATSFIRTFTETVVEEYRMRDLKKAFDDVLDHPDAAEALSHPALAPLLELAAD